MRELSSSFDNVWTLLTGYEIKGSRSFDDYSIILCKLRTNVQLFVGRTYGSSVIELAITTDSWFFIISSCLYMWLVCSAAARSVKCVYVCRIALYVKCLDCPYLHWLYGASGHVKAFIHILIAVNSHINHCRCQFANARSDLALLNLRLPLILRFPAYRRNESWTLGCVCPWRNWLNFYVFSCRSTTSSSKDRRSLSRSVGEAMLNSGASQQQTLTQRKGVLAPPQLKVAFFLIDEPIPYSVTVNESELTLAKFKDLVTKKGNYRYADSISSLRDSIQFIIILYMELVCISFPTHVCMWTVVGWVLPWNPLILNYLLLWSWMFWLVVLFTSG